MTRDRLRNIGLDINGDCHLCHHMEETINHLFKKYDLAKYVWLTTD